MSPTVFERSQVAKALLALPPHGWVSGRDRALLALSQTEVVPFTAIAELLVGDVSLSRGIAVIRTSIGIVELAGDADSRLCGPCALSRWVHMLDMTAIYSDRAISAAVIARSVAVSANSPHACDSTPGISEATGRSTLFPPVDQWGLVAGFVGGGRAPVLSVRSETSPGNTAGSSAGGDLGSRAERLERRARELIEDQRGA